MSIVITPRLTGTQSSGSSRVNSHPRARASSRKPGSPGRLALAMSCSTITRAPAIRSSRGRAPASPPDPPSRAGPSSREPRCSAPRRGARRRHDEEVRANRPAPAEGAKPLLLPHERSEQGRRRDDSPPHRVRPGIVPERRRVRVRVIPDEVPLGDGALHQSTPPPRRHVFAQHEKMGADPPLPQEIPARAA